MKKFYCPLCNSLLSKTRYYKVIGVWDERARLERDLREELKRYRLERKQLKDQYKKERVQIQRENKIAVREALQKGKAKERARADKLAKMIQNYTKVIQNLNSRIKELEEQLKRGTTPQVEGLQLEIELLKELKKQFPYDKIEHHGKAGDILQKVFFRNKLAGSILYECKKTTRYNSKFVDQIKRAVGQRQASYGVLVTTAFKKDTAGFWAEKGILIVHPFGAVYVAEVLRNIIIDLYSSKMSRSELDSRSRAIMQYIRGDEFKACVDNSIYRTRELYEMLKREMKTHGHIWQERYNHYYLIHDNISRVQSTTSNIIKGLPMRQAITSYHPKELPPPQIDI